MNDKTATDTPQDAPAVGGRLDQAVGRTCPQRAETPLGVHWLPRGLYMLTSVRGCQECAWGKVLGCWRCRGR